MLSGQKWKQLWAKSSDRRRNVRKNVWQYGASMTHRVWYGMLGFPLQKSRNHLQCCRLLIPEAKTWGISSSRQHIESSTNTRHCHNKLVWSIIILIIFFFSVWHTCMRNKTFQTCHFFIMGECSVFQVSLTLTNNQGVTLSTKPFLSPEWEHEWCVHVLGWRQVGLALALGVVDKRLGDDEVLGGHQATRPVHLLHYLQHTAVLVRRKTEILSMEKNGDS